MQFDPGHEYCKAERRALSRLSVSSIEANVNDHNLNKSLINSSSNQPPS